MAGSTLQAHLVLVPWIGGISHIIPMTDIGCLLASHGAPVTIITTPANAPIVQSRVDHAAAKITVTAIPFPGAEAGLPEGCERLDLLRSPGDVPRFFSANKQFGEAVARHCRGKAMPRRPSCIVAGMCHTWTLGLARGLGVPCYIFHGFGAFALLCVEHLYKHRTHEAVASVDELFNISVLPGFECRVSRRQLPPNFMPSTMTSMSGGTMQEVRDFDVAVDGVVVNSFEELEHGSASLLAAAKGKKVLAVGPVSLCRSPASSLDPRAVTDDDAARCMAWLDGRESRSVVYVSFGSAGHMPPAQLLQLGMALVSCPWPVLWVIKGAESLPDDVKKWLHDNIDDADGAVADAKCLVVRGWAPQVAILDHPSVGGFVTHCGWGSTLEAVAAGLPVATWPLFAEQFLNEKLIVDVLGVGVSVGVTKPTENILTASTKTEGRKAEAKLDAEVGMEQVVRALEKLMDRGGEGEERRRKARALKDMAQGALEKGGSSYMNLDKLIQSSV
jgi:flavonol-3-O-L-rhamnoside-7-O-glucosyltransferase